jgi:predicted DNA-binding protein with PD1-like motif
MESTRVKSRMLEGLAEKTFAIIFDNGDEVASGLLGFAKEHSVKAARFTAVGAFSDVMLGYFSWETKEYEKIPVREQVEVLALVGDVALKGNEPQVHAHVVVGKRDGTAHGGHLLEAHVRPTLEVILVESSRALERHMDPVSGLALIRI